VATAIDLDEEATLQAREVDDVGADRLLASERIARKAVGAEITPQAALRFGRVRTQVDVLLGVA
jgi:hypothetical protein